LCAIFSLFVCHLQLICKKYGKAIVLACRYESMRKIILQALDLKGNILIISETVFNSIDNNKREEFKEFECQEHDVWIRDDSDATSLYYRIV